MAMHTNVEIVDNFLDQKDFDSLVSKLSEYLKYEKRSDLRPSSPTLPWQVNTNIEALPEPTDLNPKLFYMTHLFYTNIIVTDEGKEFFGIGQPSSPHFVSILPLLEKLNITSLIRVKANLYPYSGETLHEHQMHVDYDFPHYAAILSLNTCDGYTKLEDGTKIESIANRMLSFDASQKHCSTTTTSDFARINININYL